MIFNYLICISTLFICFAFADSQTALGNIGRSKTASQIMTNGNNNNANNNMMNVDIKLKEIKDQLMIMMQAIEMMNLKITMQETNVGLITKKLSQLSKSLLPSIFLSEDFNSKLLSSKWEIFPNETLTKYREYEWTGGILKTRPEKGFYCVYTNSTSEILREKKLIELKFKSKIVKGAANSAYLELGGCSKKLGWDEYSLRFGPTFGGGFGSKVYVGLRQGNNDFLKYIEGKGKIDDGKIHEYTLNISPKENSFSLSVDGLAVENGKFNFPLNDILPSCRVSICSQIENPSVVEIDDVFVGSPADSCSDITHT